MERPEKEDKEIIENIENKIDLKNQKLKTEILINLTDIYHTHKNISGDNYNSVVNKIKNKILKILDEI